MHYVPGEHDFLDEEIKLYRERYGACLEGRRLYSSYVSGVHFIGLVNVWNLKAGGFGVLGDDQLAWLKVYLDGLSASHAGRGLRPRAAVGALPRHGAGALPTLNKHCR